MTVPTLDLERLVEALSQIKTASDQQINDTIRSIFPGNIVVPIGFQSVKVLRLPLPFTSLAIVTGVAFIDFAPRASFVETILSFTVPQDNAGNPLLFPAPSNIFDATAILFPTLVFLDNVPQAGAGVATAAAVALADRVLVLADIEVSGINTFFGAIGFQVTILAQ